MASVSLRLARFNVITGKSDYRWFVGLPSPAGALVIASMIYYAPRPVTDRSFALIVMVVTIFTAFSMVSPIRWRSQKGVTLQKERSLIWFLGFALILVIAFFRPRECGFLAAITYLASGPLVKLWSLAFPRALPVVAAPAEEHPPLPADGGGP
jgi:CDP-diacylglycerol--serine O-phosphatidyltransferase